MELGSVSQCSINSIILCNTLDYLLYTMPNIPRHKKARADNLAKARKQRQRSLTPEPEARPSQPELQETHSNVMLTWVENNLVPTILDDDEGMGEEETDGEVSEEESDDGMHRVVALDDHGIVNRYSIPESRR